MLQQRNSKRSRVFLSSATLASSPGGGQFSCMHLLSFLDCTGSLWQLRRKQNEKRTQFFQCCALFWGALLISTSTQTHHKTSAPFALVRTGGSGLDDLASAKQYPQAKNKKQSPLQMYVDSAGSLVLSTRSLFAAL